MARLELLRKLEGLHSVDTVVDELHITRQSAINLISRLKREGYVTARGGGRKKKMYRITMKKQRKRDQGMFDIINRYSPMKLMHWYDHQVHGHYGPEEALIDAIETKSFRAILASMKLFNHITDWPKLYKLAKEKDSWQKVGALYDVARLYFRVRKMPLRYTHKKWKRKKFLIERRYPTKEAKFYPIEKRWNVPIPFRKGDILKVITG
jgi:DNA-binding PadR family transcriptional regulator